MHKLLKKTHFEGNINILKVRDYYFNKARILNNRYRKWCLMAPIALTVVGMLFCFVVRAALQNIAPMALMADFVEDWLDIAVGVVAVLSFVIDCFLSAAVDKHLKVSNPFRELYDCEVFEILFLCPTARGKRHLSA